MPTISDPWGWAGFGALQAASLAVLALVLDRHQRRERHRYQRLLQATRAELAASQARQSELRRRLSDLQATSQLAAGVAHEINQPLSAMRLLSEQFQSSTGLAAARTDDDTSALLGLLGVEMDRMVAITEALRLLLRSQDTRIESLDLARVVQAALLYLKRPLRRAGIQLSSEGLEQPLTIDGDAQQLQAALTLLLRRSLLALAQSPRSDRRLSIRLIPGSDAAEVVIRASGPWNPPAEGQALLPNGEALDLHVVRITVSNHGGDFSRERSSEGEGSQFRLRLPLRQP